VLAHLSALNVAASVISSSVSSPTVTVSSVPAGVEVGAAFLGRTVTAISGTTVTLNGNANFAVTPGTVSGMATTNANNTVTVASTAGLYAGMNVTGTGIPVGCDD